MTRGMNAPMRKRSPGESFVRFRLESSSTCDSTQMERIGACAKAESLPDRPSPTEPLLVRKPSCRRGHRIEPPAFFWLKPKPIADGDRNFRRDVCCQAGRTAAFRRNFAFNAAYEAAEAFSRLYAARQRA